MGINLFDDSDDIEDISKIETNEEFARRYEHNKRREELQRLEDMKKKGLVDESDDSSEESDEDDNEDVFESGKRDLEFLDALVKVKKKDPVIIQEDAKLFVSESEEESEENEEKFGLVKEKPMYLKDVVAKHLIEEGPELKEKVPKSSVMSYTEEQEALRQEFLNAAKEVFDGDEGDLFMEKKKNEREEDQGGDDNDAIQSRLDEYFGGDDNLDENEMFLKNFFRNKMWVEQDDKGKKPFSEDLLGISEDEEEVEKQEQYEAEYNFRYEEGVGDRVVGHSRFTEGSVRKKNNARKLQRQSKEERMAQAEFERKEELKHLKNLKRKEIEEKLDKIRTIAGIAGDGACMLNEDDLEEDFDPEVYDQKMKEMFAMDYYEAEDADPRFHSDDDGDGDDHRKPDFDKEDEMLGLGKDWDAYGSGDGFSVLREKIKCKAVDASDEGGRGEDEVPEEGKRKRKRKVSLREKVALDKELEEYYKLDYEDTIGDLKTRFKYTTVPSQRYGLNAAEILTIDDKELNQYVSLKHLAPYREKEWKVPKIKRYNLKIKNKQVTPGENLKNRDTDKKQILKDPSHSAALQHEKNQEELNGEIGGASKRSRKRRRQAELKLSQSRLMAYGKIPIKSKNKQKL